MKKDNKILISIVVVLLVVLVGIVVGILLFPKKEYKENNQNNNSQSVEEKSDNGNLSFIYIDVANTDFLIAEQLGKSFVSDLGIIKGKTIIQSITVPANDVGPQPYIYLTNDGEVYYLPEECDFSIIEKNNDSIAECLSKIEQKKFNEKISQIYLFREYDVNSLDLYQYYIIFKSGSNKYYYQDGKDFDVNKASVVNQYENLSVYKDGTVIYKNEEQNFKTSQILLLGGGNNGAYLKDSKTNNWYVIDDNGISLYDKSLSLKDGYVYSNDVKIGYYSQFWENN